MYLIYNEIIKSYDLNKVNNYFFSYFFQAYPFSIKDETKIASSSDRKKKIIYLP